MTDLKKINPQTRDVTTVIIFFGIVTYGIHLYVTNCIHAAPGSLPSYCLTIIPWLLGLIVFSKVLSVIWRITGAFLSLVITACYFGAAWPQVFVQVSNDYSEPYIEASNAVYIGTFTIVNDSVGLTPYVSIAAIVSIIFIALGIYYKLKIKKVSIYD